MPQYKTFHPTQLGYTISGDALGSQLVLGRDVSSNFEGIGFGSQGRPDYLTRFTINLTDEASFKKKGSVVIDTSDLMAVMNSNPNAPTGFYFSLKEVATCDAGVEKRMMVLASQIYPATT